MSDNFQKIHDVLGKIDIKDMSLDEIFKRLQEVNDTLEEDIEVEVRDELPLEVKINIDKQLPITSYRDIVAYTNF